ncbi:MAG: hypothetical protein AAGD25_37975 [Cyanobacteria bacterium P01_F01_bin.150]
MTNADFMVDDDQFIEEEPDFPTVFGIQMTPTVVGVLLALLGIGAAVFAYLNLLQPVLEQRSALKAEVTELEGQIQDPAEAQRLIDAAEERVAQAEQLEADVLALFADEASLETLLLDINERVESANAGVTDEARRATLSKFNVDDAASGLVDDGSLGTAVNGRLNRLVYDLEMEGSFAQIQSILRSIERLQPLLIVQDFRTELQPVERTLNVDERGTVLSIESEPPRLKTSFQVDAISPAEAPPPSAESVEGEEAAVEGEGA